MKPQIHRIIKLTEAQLVLKLHTAALMYSNYVDTTLLFIFSKGKESPYGVYEVSFYQYNFMHLAGIKSNANNIINNSHYSVSIKSGKNNVYFAKNY